MGLKDHNILSAQMFTLADRMFINADTLASLQIFRSELHPNSQVQGLNALPSGFKENLSVFGLFKPLAYTPQGQTKLRQIFLQPTTNLTAIQERQQAISLFSSAENEGLVHDLQRALRKVQDMRKVFSSLEKGARSTLFYASPDHGLWRTLQKFCVYAVASRDSLARLFSQSEVAGTVERVINQPSKPAVVGSPTNVDGRLLVR